jgi:hypothetical protein
MMAADQLLDLLSIQLEVLPADETVHILGDDPHRAIHDYPRGKVVFLHMVKAFHFG